MSLFESLRLKNGIAEYLDEHLHRLRKACADRHFTCPPEALIAAGVLLESSGKEGFARIYVTAGDGTVAAPADQCRVLVFIESREQPQGLGYRVALQEEACYPLFGGLKTGNYWMNVDRLQQAQREGYQEALLFNEHAELISGCMANVFVVHGTRIRTPSLECGARDGVIREKVMGKVTVQLCSLFVHDVLGADEIFLTNSWIGVMPVTSVDGRLLPSQQIARHLATP